MGLSSIIDYRLRKRGFDAPEAVGEKEKWRENYVTREGGNGAQSESAPGAFHNAVGRAMNNSTSRTVSGAYMLLIYISWLYGLRQFACRLRCARRIKYTIARVCARSMRARVCSRDYTKSKNEEWKIKRAVRLRRGRSLSMYRLHLQKR